MLLIAATVRSCQQLLMTAAATERWKKERWSFILHVRTRLLRQMLVTYIYLRLICVRYRLQQLRLQEQYKQNIAGARNYKIYFTDRQMASYNRLCSHLCFSQKEMSQITAGVPSANNIILVIMSIRIQTS